ncbi:hypothetical protein T03_738 [Trichinella britovi]|uniref:Uncharacterized protein n=2 Tax=Trichinella TaxID=6333 RepID=A0A0V0SQA4_9BILA|nr:hypothetical protein T05_13517 [Trichinella murrelli]KRX29057.1 hypothetical protein T05_12015 [Trichinella murrelli]KRX29294.1 hypothetical protein T05_12203 [Trichinella murrelli]KRY04855.1 hypothetical protein T03_738 [Trichinella britovi]
MEKQTTAVLLQMILNNFVFLNLHFHDNSAL